MGYFDTLVDKGPSLSERESFEREYGCGSFSPRPTCGCELPRSPEKDTKAPLIQFPDRFIKRVFVDEIEKVVVVKFGDGGKEIVKCSEHDDFDVTIGVALGIARHIFSSHSKFYKHVVTKKTTYVKRLPTVVEEKTEYDLYLEWCEENHKRKPNRNTFKKNRTKYLARMEGEK